MFLMLRFRFLVPLPALKPVCLVLVFSLTLVSVVGFSFGFSSDGILFFFFTSDFVSVFPCVFASCFAFGFDNIRWFSVSVPVVGFRFQFRFQLRHGSLVSVSDVGCFRFPV